MADKWKGKIAVITGSSSGIGFATFQQFIKNGIITIGLDINIEKTIEYINQEEISNGFAYECDISNENSVAKIFSEIKNKFSFIHILINNAGIGRKAEVLDDDEESLRNMNLVIDTNFRGLLHCTRQSFKLMSASNDYGLIININSITGHLVPFTSFSMNVYSPTKFAGRALTESIRHELFRNGNKKIRIGNISPGLVESNFAASSKYFDELEQHSFSDVPLLKPIEIAKCIMFILSTPYEVNINDIIIRSTGEQF
ncbi:hypothetical protein PVAND_008024 [Polypedilum vanderplanki]|uniref:Uncharacterized protein n=1 Tax=Polypedilum vanderplanki TaxID=319348 RepID=A0A9J6C986_POLVA|nr:hypothetical protein PVAND_008024 [Polypedilum vanderplanki]